MPGLSEYKEETKKIKLFEKVMKVKIKLKEIDLSKGEKHNHPDIKYCKLYLAKVNGRYETGYFSEEHYGLSFSGFYSAGLQFDTPGWNSSGWEQLWEVIEIPDKVRNLMEKIYENEKRKKNV